MENINMTQTIAPNLNEQWIVTDKAGEVYRVHYFNISGNGLSFHPVIFSDGCLHECSRDWLLSNLSEDENKFRMNLAKYLPMLSEKLKAGDVNLAVN